MKWYETTARYVLGVIYLFGAVDGVLFLFFGIYMHGKPPAQYTFLLALQATTYFWAFMKLIQAVGAVSLLLNYKPALGTALLIPISSVLCLFYFFEFHPFIPAGMVIIASTLILSRAYAKTYVHLFDDYPLRAPLRIGAPTSPNDAAIAPPAAARKDLRHE
jgi:hypothetical protein